MCNLQSMIEHAPSQILKPEILKSQIAAGDAVHLLEVHDAGLLPAPRSLLVSRKPVKLFLPQNLPAHARPCLSMPVIAS